MISSYKEFFYTILGVAYHNAKNGCQRCTTVGKHSDISNTTIFPEFNAPNRCDEGFRAGIYKDHQTGRSPLLNLKMDMINDIPIGDELHLIDAGVTKQLIHIWEDGKKLRMQVFDSRKGKHKPVYALNSKTLRNK